MASVNLNEGLGHQALGGGPTWGLGALGDAERRGGQQVMCPKPSNEVTTQRGPPRQASFGHLLRLVLN